jgi:hypothetical protein
MPLKKGASRKTISKNISELSHGEHADERTQEQNVAIAMNEARKTGKGKALKRFEARYGKSSNG